MGSSHLIFRISNLQGFTRVAGSTYLFKYTRIKNLHDEYIGVVNEIHLKIFLCNFSSLLYFLNYIFLFCIPIDAPVYFGTRIPLCHTRLSVFWEGPDLNAAYSLFRFLRKGQKVQSDRVNSKRRPIVTLTQRCILAFQFSAKGSFQQFILAFQVSGRNGRVSMKSGQRHRSIYLYLCSSINKLPYVRLHVYK